jgi:hypothetical protein
MERKGTAVVTAEIVEQGLKQATTTKLEEQALRMRYGVTVEKTVALPQVAEEDSELADQLLLIEMRLLSALKHRRAAQGAKASPTARNPTKSKIVAALKAKKK